MLRDASGSNKLASLEATLVRNSAHSLNHLLTGVKCRATSVAKKLSSAHLHLHYTYTNIYTYTSTTPTLHQHLQWAYTCTTPTPTLEKSRKMYF